ncbi:type II toxin-antitoxin system VapC family toxin [Neorhizobium petrolearium]|uniref:type II toxin-antitoxin system VapC family toxin n=1 Tax=Neorhizobium petrolearium TaxID=515361 RepID=UPI003F138444
MASIDRIYLDTNVFVLAFERKDRSGAILSDLFFNVEKGSMPLFVTSELTLSELLVIPYRNGDAELIEAYAVLLQNDDWLEVVPVKRPVLIQAAMLRSHRKGLKLPDAIHLSSASGAGCSHFLTADMGINAQVAEQEGPLTVLRPDEPTLTSLIESLAR